VAQAVMKRVYGGHMLKKLAEMTPTGPPEPADAAPVPSPQPPLAPAPGPG
jgi:hypothetical protein